MYIKTKTLSNDLTGQLLVAMPGITDERFAKSVIYICTHTDEGAMGLVINRLVKSMTFPELLTQLDIQTYGMEDHIRVHVGGPVDSERGFVLHTPEYSKSSTVVLNEEFALTSTLDILRDMASGYGPLKSLLALGYAGWGPGQLDNEMMDNGWLNVPANNALVYDGEMDNKWERAISQLGVNPIHLNAGMGRA